MALVKNNRNWIHITHHNILVLYRKHYDIGSCNAEQQFAMLLWVSTMMINALR